MRLLNPVLSLMVLGALCMTSAAQLPEGMAMDGYCKAVSPGQDQSTNFFLDPGNIQATFIASWINATSSLDLVLSDPSGKDVNSADPGIIYQVDNNTVQYTIPNPGSGSWTARVFARIAPEWGEQYCIFLILTLPKNNVSNNTSA
jgi:hypothetical protein